EAEQPGVSAAAVCRRHNIATSMIFRWRVQLGFGSGKPTTLAAVRIADERGNSSSSGAIAAAVLQDILPIPPGAVAVELADGRCVFAPPGSDPEEVRRYIAQQATRAMRMSSATSLVSPKVAQLTNCAAVSAWGSAVVAAAGRASCASASRRSASSEELDVTPARSRMLGQIPAASHRGILTSRAIPPPHEAGQAAVRPQWRRQR